MKTSNLKTIASMMLTAGVILVLDMPLAVAQNADSQISDIKKSVLLYLPCDSLKSEEPDVIKINVDPELQPGKFGSAYRIERRLELNLIKNPTFASGNTGEWITVGAPLINNQGRSEKNSVMIDSSNYLRQIVPDIKPDKMYCFSIYGKGTGNLMIKMKSASAKESAILALTSDYQRLSLGMKAEGTEITITVLTDGKAVVDDAQLEGDKTFPASFTPKPPPARSVECVTISLNEQNFNANEGSVACWVNLDAPGAVYGGHSCNIFAVADDLSKKYKDQRNLLNLYAWVKRGEKNWKNSITGRFSDKNGESAEFIGLNVDTVQSKVWNHFIYTWKIRPDGNSEVHFYLNGKEAGNKLDMQLGEFGLPAKMQIGYADGGYLDGLMDEFYIFNRMLNAEEAKILEEMKQPIGK